MMQTCQWSGGHDRWAQWVATWENTKVKVFLCFAHKQQLAEVHAKDEKVEVRFQFIGASPSGLKHS